MLVCTVYNLGIVVIGKDRSYVLAVELSQAVPSKISADASHNTLKVIDRVPDKQF